MFSCAPTAHGPRLRAPNFRYSESRAPVIGRDAPAEIREVWHNAYEAAKEYYTSERAPSPDNLARNAAWKTVKMYWEEPRRGKFRARNPDEGVIAGKYQGETIRIGEDTPLVAPGETAALCKLIELSWIAADGTLQVQRFKEPGLPDVFWNNETKILYMFPNIELGEGVCVIGAQQAERGRGAGRMLRNLFSGSRPENDVFIGLDDQVDMYELWAKRDPRCRHHLSVPSEPLDAYGVADTIVYRSDKWEGQPNPDPDKRGSQEYLHQFGLDVAIEETPGNPPPAIMVRGGKLDVLEGGIAH